MLPAEWVAVEEVVPQGFGGLVMIGLGADKISVAALRLVNMVCALGEQPSRALREYCKLVGEQAPAAPRRDLEKGEAILWIRGQRRARLIQVEPSRIDRRPTRELGRIGYPRMPHAQD